MSGNENSNIDFALMMELIKDNNKRLRNMDMSIKDLKENIISVREDLNGV